MSKVVLEHSHAYIARAAFTLQGRVAYLKQNRVVPPNLKYLLSGHLQEKVSDPCTRQCVFELFSCAVTVFPSPSPINLFHGNRQAVSGLSPGVWLEVGWMVCPLPLTLSISRAPAAWEAPDWQPEHVQA